MTYDFSQDSNGKKIINDKPLDIGQLNEPMPADTVSTNKDSLEWARQAYARLKAQHESNSKQLELSNKVNEEINTQASTTIKTLNDDLENFNKLISDESILPQLGNFDSDFAWSSEILAAQGLKSDQVTLEEIDWLTRLRRGLKKTRQGLVTQLLEILGDDPLTPGAVDDLETLLLQADVGINATDHVLSILRQRMNEEVLDPAEGIRILKDELKSLLEKPIHLSGKTLLSPDKNRLNIWLLVGVNGVGKTTTLGKIANLAVRSGYTALIAAADTFRAAAVQQVEVWGKRSNVPVISNTSVNADPAAVVFDALNAAKGKGTNLVLIDTAGRLQTKHNLMEELAKIRRVIDRLAPDAAIESLLVLDASQGQNGLRQAIAFSETANLTGVVLTKLDGSARGGVALAVASDVKLPIRFIGAGEGIRDLHPFNSFEFVEALLAEG